MKETLNAKSLESTPDLQTGWEHKNRKRIAKIMRRQPGKTKFPQLRIPALEGRIVRT